MNDADFFDCSRRRWLAHCTALAFAIGTLPAASARTQGPVQMPSQVPVQEVPHKASGRTILVVGDSLSAEYGLARGTGWVALLQTRLTQQKIAAVALNASISGDTTAGGRTRLPALLTKHRPDIVVLELGGNDALRGLPLTATRDNLDAMAKAATAAGAKVVIAGMQLPPNYGRQYSDQFAALFASVAKNDGAALVPFLLAGVADVPQAESLFQPDRIHPVAAAHPKILDNVWTVLDPMLKT